MYKVGRMCKILNVSPSGYYAWIKRPESPRSKKNRRLEAIIGVIFKYLSKIPYFGWTDRTCGAFFGLIKGFLIVCVLFIAFAALPPKDGAMIKKSFFAPYLVHVPNQLIKITNRDMKKLFSESTEGLNKVWKRK